MEKIPPELKLAAISFIIVVVCFVILWKRSHSCEERGGISVGPYGTDCWVEGRGFIAE